LAETDVALVRGFLKAIGEGRYPEAAAMLGQRAEWHNTERFPGPRVCRGPQEIERFWEDLYEAYAINRPATEIERVDHRGDVVTVELHAQGRGRGSGVPVDIHWAHRLLVRDGKVDRVETYGSYDRALEAAGGS
jgi:ketosteroid isomerase-like protein